MTVRLGGGLLERVRRTVAGGGDAAESRIAWGLARPCLDHRGTSGSGCSNLAYRFDAAREVVSTSYCVPAEVRDRVIIESVVADLQMRAVKL